MYSSLPPLRSEQGQRHLPWLPMPPARQSMGRPALADVDNRGRQSIAPGGRQSLAKPDGRQSVGPGGRRSSVVPGGATAGARLRDPRQLTDRAFKRRAVEKLIAYLVEHGYDRQLSVEKLFNAPTNSDFVHIISFLLRRAIPDFKFDGRYEDELPVVVKTFGYPFPISRANLTAIGAPHAWPSLLAAIAWFVDLLKYSEAEATRDLEAEGFDAEDDGHKMFFAYLSEGYALFLEGQDDLSGLDERIAFTFESKNTDMTQHIAEMKSANERLQRELDGLQGKSPLEQAREQAEILRADTAKFEKHIADLHEHRSKVQQKLTSATSEREEKQGTLANVEAQVAAAKETIAVQEVTPADVQRMHADTSRLETELSGVRAQKEALSTQGYEEDRAIQRAVERMEGKVQQLNNCSLRLHMIPAEAKNAGGASHQIALQTDRLSSDPESLLSLDPTAVLIPTLSRLRGGFSEELGTAQDELLAAEEQQARRDEEAAERRDELAALNAQLTKLEKEAERAKDEHAKELAERKAETEQLEEKLHAARSTAGQDVVASQSEVSALRKELDEFNQEAAKQRERMYSILNSSLDMLLLHKENVENQLRSLKQHVAAKKDALVPLLHDDIEPPPVGLD